MEYINIKQAAAKWNISERQVQNLCKSGVIIGAKRFSRTWQIPENAQKPIDKRTKNAKSVNIIDDGLPHLPMPKRNPLLIYTDLYQTAGTADNIIASFKDQPEAARIMQMQFDYYRGNIDKVYEDTNYFLKAHSGFNAVVGAGMYLAMSAIWRGDIHLWQKARQHIYEAPCKNETERQSLSFWVAATDSKINDTTEFPEWFKNGEFDYITGDSYCVARLFYVKYLFISAHDLASGKIKLKDVERFGLMRTMPHIIEPMLSQAKYEKTLIPEIYLRFMAATVYHNLGRDEKAIPHIDIAIKLCLPDKLYGLLAEYRTNLDTLLDDRLMLIDKNAYKKMCECHKTMMNGWIKLHNKLLDRNVSDKLTAREREVAKYAAFGIGNDEIASRMNISVSSVKSHIQAAMTKLGVLRRNEFGFYV